MYRARPRHRTVRRDKSGGKMTTGITRGTTEPLPGEATVPELRDALALCSARQRRYLSVLVRTGERDVVGQGLGLRFRRRGRPRGSQWEFR